MEFKPHKYQQYAINRILELPRAALFLDMGLGKTVITLIAIKQLLLTFEVGKVLVIAPKKVAESTWKQEAEKWDETKGLRVSVVLGTAKQREAALKREADIYIINRENVVWLYNFYKQPKGCWPFDMAVLDESTSFKSRAAKRWRALRIIHEKFSRILELTGTPAANGLLDLWAQIYLLDSGKRLGRTMSAFRDRWFKPDARNGPIVYSYKPLPGSQEEITKAISDISFSMAAKDYLELPKLIINRIPVILSEKDMRLYKRLEREKILEFKGEDVTAGSAAVLSGKLLQLANGAIYDDAHGVQIIHEAKLEVLSEIIEAAQGEPVLVFYSFRHDLARILEKFPDAVELKGDKTVKAWNEGGIKVLLAHPASAGYGLNLQAGGSIIVWFGLTWSLEQYEQANARLYRQGQDRPVIVHHLVAKGTMDEAVDLALQHKRKGQEAMLEAVKAKIAEEV